MDNLDTEGAEDKLSEEQIQDYLDRISERISPANALVFHYRFHALFPEQKILEDDKFTIKKGYLRLRQHEDYYRYALSMVIFLLEGYGSKTEIDSLQKHIRFSKVYESDIRNDSLNLWRMLTNIATDLSQSEEDVRGLVGRVGNELKVNTEHMAVRGEYSLATALRAFRKLEEKGRLAPMLKGHSEEKRRALYLYQLLEHLHKKKLIETYVKDFNPHRPVTLAVLKVESRYQNFYMYGH